MAGGEQGHQGGPGGVGLIGGDAAQVLEQSLSGGEALAGLLPEGFGQIAGELYRVSRRLQTA